MKKIVHIISTGFYLLLINVKNSDKIKKKFKQNGIETGIHYRPIHTMSMYKNKKKLPITEKAGKQIISLPTHPNLTNSDVTEIISKINKFC